MSQLAVNYSPQAVNLANAGKIQVDLYKCRSNPNLIDIASQHGEVYVHLPLRAGRGNLDQVDWDFLENLLAHTHTPFVNLYLAPHAPDFPELGLESTDPIWNGRLIERMIHDVNVVKSRFGAEHVILENAPWDVTPGYAVPRLGIEPCVIRAVIEETGCGLLLDLAHARMAALHLEMDAKVYIEQLPVDRLRELHICGVQYDEMIGAWRDHFAMTDSDWRLVEWAFRRMNAGRWSMPEIVALEYGGVTPRLEWRSKSEVLMLEIPRLQALIQQAGMSVTRQLV